MNDLRFAFRQLLKNPGFTIVAVVTLAICLGANLSIFAVIDSVLLRPLPFPQSDRLVTMFNIYPKAGIQRSRASLANYYERRGNLSTFSAIAELRQDTVIVGETGATQPEPVMRVSPEFFTVLRVGPVLGRAFTEEETTYQTDGEAILTDSYWRHEFNGDPKILGRQLRVDGLPKTIVGVLPPNFRYLSSKARLYLPLSSDPADRTVKRRHSNQDYELIGRLNPGVTLAAAQAQMDSDNAAHAAEYPDAKLVADAGFRTQIKPLRADHVGSVRPTLLLLQAGVFLLLVIGSVNLINLILIRASGRARELAIRLSLGAGRRHVVRQVITETVLLTTIGGACGLFVCASGIRLLEILGARQLPLGAQISFDGRLAIVAMVTAIVLGAAIGGLIAFLNLCGHPGAVLQTESRAATASLGAQRLRHSFIVAQVALAFVLLVGGGLLGLSLNNSTTAFTVKGHVPKPGESIQAHYFYGVHGDVFAALGIPLREGRFLRSADSESKVCVVDEDFARRYWPQGVAIGQRLFIGPTEGPDADAFTVVGVVGAMKQAELVEHEGQGAVYFPYKLRTAVDVFAVVRTIQRPESFALTLQKVVRGIDPDLPVSDLRSMEVRITDSLMVRRSPALLAGIFAAVALLLAAIGTYGVLAYAVSQRRREIGVRMALGALPQHISNHFLSVGLRLLATGTILGLAGAWVAGRAMQSILFGVPPLSLEILAGAILIMAAVSLLASWLPARHAARVDPMEALRHE